MSDQLKGSISSLASESRLYPQEVLLKVKKDRHQLFIGIPKESSEHEYRVSLTPKAVELLAANGHNVVVQSGAGKGANFTDHQYSEAGAKISSDVEEVFSSDIVLKVKFPSLEELKKIKNGKTLISTIHLNDGFKERINLINSKKITAVGYEYIEDKVGGLPIVRAMSEIAGCTAIPIASEYLSATNKGMGVLLGGITGVPPTKVVILGAGTVAEYAARAAVGFGADVKVFDPHIYKLRRLKHLLNRQIFTSTIDHSSLQKALKDADVVIGAVRAEKGLIQHIVSEEMVAQMKKGAVILDVSIDEGGCFETSEPTNLRNPVFTKYDIIHYCVPNIASRVPRTASRALSNILTPVLLDVSQCGGINDIIFQHKWFMKGVYAYKGSLTNYHLSKKLDLKFKDLTLLMAARF
ncbi:alanine dehydrogenase [Reichenbachiella sp. MALMAid0571]|uniref:alanine dehydrogenase n=1 Tax=Reichenbachiella sp. MALMAid0571 TaxID=3143939 RepID=UPI0032DF7A7D